MTNVHGYQVISELSESRAMASEGAISQQRRQWHEQTWKQAREDVAVAYQAMSLAVRDARAVQGKHTSAHHYMTEAKLVTFSLFGRFEKIEPDGLSAHELALVQSVASHNAALIAQGHSYAFRKRDLVAFASALRITAIHRTRSAPRPMPSVTCMEEHNES